MVNDEKTLLSFQCHVMQMDDDAPNPKPDFAVVLLIGGCPSTEYATVIAQWLKGVLEQHDHEIVDLDYGTLEMHRVRPS